MRLNQQIIDKLALSKGKKEQFVSDDELPRLYLRLRAGGGRTWVAQYRLGGRQQRYKLGNAAVMSLGEARQRARKVLVSVDEGRDPMAEKAERQVALAQRFADVRNDYLAVVEKDLRPRTLDERKRYLRDYWKTFDRIAVSSITRAMVAAELRRIKTDSGAITSDRARSALSGFFGWCIGEGFVKENPVVLTNPAVRGKTSRSRVLDDAELAAVYRAAPDSQYGVIVRLLALTAQRRQEIGSLRWTELVLDGDSPMIVLPVERAKNKREHVIPLVPAALALLPSPPRWEQRVYVFGRDDVTGFRGWAYGKTTIDAASGVADWTLHDLRRTAATRMADLGVQPHVIESILNHAPPGIAATYNRSTYAAEKRAALELWATHLLTIAKV